ncbi:MAG TPA: SAM-dependent methyltransferase [Pseudonocardiaceae bacterium]|nr:SAM-dependent methyltransferase [Pseudonocardiaceae bacterium]
MGHTWDEESLGTEFDLDRPNTARMYDYWLGGAANLAVDRELAERMIAIDPAVVDIARANRSFLRRTVRFCVANGVTQFLDLGSGIPTVGNVHEIAQRAHPDCRVAYVDIEGVAVAHSRKLLRDNPLATITQADLRDTEAVLNAPAVTGLLDFAQPIAVLALMVLQYFPDRPDHPGDILARYRARLASGSFLVISHLTGEEHEIDMTGLTNATSNASTSAHLRSRTDIAALLGDAVPVEPGVVGAPHWRPDDPQEYHAGSLAGSYVAVGSITQ